VFKGSKVDFERQRLAMVGSQLRTSGVTSRRVLAAFAALPRERFVPPPRRPLAYMDEDIEVWPSIDGASARFLLAPAVLARLVQLAEIGPGDRVLDIGCATGYSSAILAGLAHAVIGLEAQPELAEQARAALRERLTVAGSDNPDNVDIVTGALEEGHPGAAPYNVILLNGGVPAVPQRLTAQLDEGGRFVAVMVNGLAGRAYRFLKCGGELSGLPHFDAGAHPLPGFAPAPSFTF
jgi:protein-L-isoaspartate(D-aspartate) O-methyltransferase